jgi:hypothetical protein
VLLKTLTILVAVTALAAVPASASAATIDQTLQFGIQSGAGGYTYTQYTMPVQYDCSTNTFTGSGGSKLVYHDGYSGTALSADTTVTGTVAPNVSISLSFAGPGTGSLTITLPLSPFSSADQTLYELWTPGASYQALFYGATGSCRRFPAVTSADQCKSDGWKAVSSADDTLFKNQGDCVSYVTTRGKNAPAGS